MSQQWYVARDKKKVGPYSPEQLKALAAQGQLAPNDMLFKEGGAKWVAANSVKGLFADAPKPALKRVGVAANTEQAKSSSTVHQPLDAPKIQPTSSPKDPLLMAVVSFFIPPLGQLLIGQTTKAIVLFLVTPLFLLPLAMLTLGFGLLLCPIYNILAAVDAYLLTRELQMGHPIGAWQFFSADLATWGREQYRTNPQRVLLAGGGAAFGLVFVICLGCIGLFTIGGNGGGGLFTANDALTEDFLPRKPGARWSYSQDTNNDALTEDFLPRKPGARWSYSQDTNFNGSHVVVHIDYDFEGESEIKQYVSRAEAIHNGQSVELPFNVQQKFKKIFTRTTRVKRDGPFLLVMEDDKWEPWIKVNAGVGESWDGEKVDKTQIRYRYTKRGEHQGIKTAVVEEEMLVDGKRENVIERVFGKNIGLLSEESYHETNGKHTTTYKRLIDDYKTLGKAGSNPRLTDSEKKFFE